MAIIAQHKGLNAYHKISQVNARFGAEAKSDVVVQIKASRDVEDVLETKGFSVELGAEALNAGDLRAPAYELIKEHLDTPVDVLED